MKLAQIFLISTVYLTSLSAFTFDKWKSGIELSEAIYIARDNNIPLSTQGNVFFSKRFDWKQLKNHQKHRVFYYKENLLGADARVALHFTKESKTLYMVKVNWGLYGKNRLEFEEMIYALLDKKYGKKNIVLPSNIGEYVLYKKRVWMPDVKTEVQTQSSSAGMGLTYLDKVQEKENQETNKKKKLEIIVRDAGKF
jgi:hypothetical protein